MEENKGQKYINETPQIAVSNTDYTYIKESTYVQQTEKSLFKRVVRDIRIILVVFVIFIFVVVIYSIARVAKLVSTIPSACTEKTEQMHSSADEFKSTFSKITINGKRASAVKATVNGDCLTASGAEGSATFGLAASNVNEANEHVIKSLGSAVPPLGQSYSPGRTTNNTRILYLSTSITGSNGSSYKVYYYLRAPIVCQEFGAATCETYQASKIYDLMNKPIESVVISLM